MRIPIHFKNKDNLTLRGFIFKPRKYETAIIFLHGFPSHCQSFTASRVSKAIEKTKYLLMTFDFSHTKTSDGKFEEKLISKEVEDIKCAIDYLEKNYPFKKLILIGHSTGAINAALYGYKDERIDKMVLIAGSGDLKQGVQYEFTPIQVRQFWTKGYATYNRPGKWYHRKRIKKAYYDEFFKLDVLKSLSRFKKPVLIVHPEKDEYISVSEDPQELFKAANRPKKLVIIKDADHRFSKRLHFYKLLKVVRKFVRKT